MAAIPGSVTVTGIIAPTDTSDTYPVIDPNYGIGGYREVLTLAERDAIPAERKRQGMLVYVTEDTKVYQLDGAGAWVEFTTTGGGGGGGGGGGDTYTNATPTATTLGGISTGTTFSAKTMQEMWDMLLYPYQAPSFSSFGISGVSSTLEIGDAIAAGAKTLTWGTSNSGNVQANSIIITDVTANSVLATGSANDGTEDITLATEIKRSNPGDSYSWKIDGTNSKGSPMSSRTFTVTWRAKKFYGTSASASLDSAGVSALTAMAGATSLGGTYSMAAGGYKYFAWPDSFGSPTAVTGFKDAATNLAVSMASSSDDAAFSQTQNGWNYALVSVTNSFGASLNYRVYRTKNVLGGSINIAVS
jgi:hypothetical protein